MNGCCALLHRRRACFTHEAAEAEAQASTRPHRCLSQRSHHLISAQGLTVKVLTLSLCSYPGAHLFFSFLFPVRLPPSVHSIQFDARKPHQSNSYSTSSFNLEWSCHQDWHQHLSETFATQRSSHLDTLGQFPLSLTFWCYASTTPWHIWLGFQVFELFNCTIRLRLEVIWKWVKYGPTTFSSQVCCLLEWNGPHPLCLKKKEKKKKLPPLLYCIKRSAFSFLTPSCCHHPHLF